MLSTFTKQYNQKLTLKNNLKKKTKLKVLQETKKLRPGGLQIKILCIHTSRFPLSWQANYN